MGPRSTNQPSVLIRIAGLVSVFVILIIIYFLVDDHDGAPSEALRGTNATHQAEQFISYHCRPDDNLTYLPTSKPLMGLPWPLPKYFHQQDKSMVVRLQLSSSYSIVLDLSRQAVDKGAVQGASNRFCSTQRTHSASQDSYFHAIDTIKVIISSSLVDAIAVNSTLPRRLLRRVRHPEAYVLLVKEDGRVVLIAHNEQGVLYGLGSLSQMLLSPMGMQLPAEIMDWPETNWRGLLVDVARHFQPLPVLYKVLDGMVASKLNRLHLHLTDAQGFPVLLNDSLSDYNLTHLVTNSPAYAQGKYYTIADLLALVAYAKDRGIEIMPEIDMPAHSYSWNNAFMNISIMCEYGASKGATPLNIYPLDITQARLYGIIEEILTQIAGIFPSKYLHVGGDEVDEKCWLESADVLRWLEERNLSAKHITKYFETKVFEMVYRLHKVPVVWQGIVDSESMPDYTAEQVVTAEGRLLTESAYHTLQPSVLTARRLSALSALDGSHPRAAVMPWKCWGGMAMRTAETALTARHPVIMAACWYLDFNVDWLSYLQYNHLYTLKTNYRNASEELVLGGQGSIWTENTDVTNLQCRVFPRLGSIAYRLWGVSNTLCLSSYVFNNTYLANLYGGMAEEVATLDSSSGATVGSLAAANAATSCQMRPIGGTIRINTLSTKMLYSAYAIYNHYLQVAYGIQSMQEVIHVAANGGEYIPYYPSDLHNTLQVIDAMRSGVSIPRDTKTVKSTAVNLTALQPLVDHYREHDLFANNNFSTYYQLYSSTGSAGSAGSSGQYSTSTSTGSTVSRAFPLSSILTNSIYLTSLCYNIPEYIHRPLTTAVVKIAQLNIADGSAIDSTGGDRNDKVLRQNLLYTPNHYLAMFTNRTYNRNVYLQTYLSTLANDGYLAVGLNELVHWDGLYSTSDIVKNTPQVVQLAAQAGFVHAHMTNSKAFNGYPLGMVSTLPFTVIKEMGSPAYQRGFLHVYHPTVRLHVFIIHLHAHSSSSRYQEVQRFIQEELTDLLAAKERVLLMGDFNTLSPIDRIEHERMGMMETILSREHPMLMMWRKKFLTASQNEIDYRPMHAFLKLGMRDVCVDSCCKTAHVDHCEEMVWFKGTANHHQYTDNSTDIEAADNNSSYIHHSKQELFAKCMTSHCSHTSPTKFHPEWPFDDLDSPAVRMDFILASPFTYPLPGFNATEHFHASVGANSLTDIASDHYPMVVEFADPSLPSFNLFR